MSAIKDRPFYNNFVYTKIPLDMHNMHTNPLHLPFVCALRRLLVSGHRSGCQPQQKTPASPLPEIIIILAIIGLLG